MVVQHLLHSFKLIIVEKKKNFPNPTTTFFLLLSLCRLNIVAFILHRIVSPQSSGLETVFPNRETKLKEILAL